MKGSKHLHTPACTAILVFTGFLACVASDSARVRRERWDKSSLRSRRLEVAGERENGRARGRHARCFFVPTTSKRLLRRLGQEQKKKMKWRGRERGEKVSSSPFPLPFHFLLLSRYNSTGNACYVGYRVPCSASLFCMIHLTHLMLRHRPLSFSRKFDGVILMLFFISQ